MNIIKALEGLSGAQGVNDAPKADAPPERAPVTPPEPDTATVNVMASVLERHERISNRVRNKN